MFFLEERDAKPNNSAVQPLHQEDASQHSKEEKAVICPVKRIQANQHEKKSIYDYIQSIKETTAKLVALNKSGSETELIPSDKTEPEKVEPKKPAVAVFVKRENWKVRVWRELKPQLFAGVISLALVVSLCVGVNASDYHLGYEALVDGETLGLVTDTQQVDTAIAQVQEEIREFMGDKISYSKEPVYIRRIVAGKEVTSTEEMKKKLLANVDCMVECYGIFIDGQAQAGLITQEAADWVLDQYKSRFVEPGVTEIESIEFCEKVETKQDFLHIGMLQTPEEVLAMLDGAVTASAVTYTTTDSDTLWGISETYGISVEKIKELNPGIQEDTLTGGIKLALEQPVPMLTVKTVQTMELTEAIPREVQKIEDANLYQDTTVVAQEGEDGEARVVAKITKINGTEQNREVLSSQTIKNPIAKIEKIGTKELPPTTGSGSFSRPASGSLSSRYGARWGRSHNGIDIAGATDSNVLAADGGVVTYAGWMQGYGNYVVINHENGYETAYGHNNSIVVSVGDRVAKGSVIAKMGNTGNSTGTHCHFEVKKNGVFQDPLQFVNY